MTVRQEPPPPVPEDTASEPQEIYQSTKIRFPKPAQGVSDVIDYKIFGSEMQFVEIELDPEKAPWPKRAR